MSKKNFTDKVFAIKVGNGVNDKIVDTWKECKKFVLGYNAIYKSFNNRAEAEKYLNSWNDEEIEKELKRKYYFYKKNKTEEIKRNFDFYIPTIIFNNLIERKYNKEDMLALIDIEIRCNKSISKANAKKLINYVQTSYK